MPDEEEEELLTIVDEKRTDLWGEVGVGVFAE